MKKIFTLMIAAGFVTVASAQSNGFGHDKYNQHSQQPVGSFYGKRGGEQKFNNAHQYKMDEVNQNKWEESKHINGFERQRNEELVREHARYERNKQVHFDQRFEFNKKCR